jgi:Phage integrase family
LEELMARLDLVLFEIKELVKYLPSNIALRFASLASDPERCMVPETRARELLSDFPEKLDRLCLSLLMCYLVSSASLSFAQVTSVTGDQSPPIPYANHDYINYLVETVNPSNGALSVRLKVPEPPGRGFTVPFAFEYDSNIAAHLGYLQWVDNTGLFSTGGWSYALPRLSMQQKQYVVPPVYPTASPSVCDSYSDYAFSDLSGVNHLLGLAIVQPANTGPECLTPGEYDTNFLSGGDATVQASCIADDELEHCLQLLRQLKPTCKTLGLMGVNWHWFRHANATLLDAVGTPLGTVQALLGHSSSEITRDVYLHSIPADARAAVQKVEDLLIGPKWTQVEQFPKTVSRLIQ